MDSGCGHYLLMWMYFTGDAVFAALRSIIIVDLLEIKALTNGFGLTLLFQGIASLSGSPIAGLMFDLSRSYDISFYLAGSVIFIGGVMYCSLRPLQRYLRAKKKKIIVEETLK